MERVYVGDFGNLITVSGVALDNSEMIITRPNGSSIELLCVSNAELGRIEAKVPMNTFTEPGIYRVSMKQNDMRWTLDNIHCYEPFHDEPHTPRPITLEEQVLFLARRIETRENDIINSKLLVEDTKIKIKGFTEELHRLLGRLETLTQPKDLKDLPNITVPLKDSELELLL